MSDYAEHPHTLPVYGLRPVEATEPASSQEPAEAPFCAQKAGLPDIIVRSQQLRELTDEVLASLKVREEQISTGIGSGVAIPHAFSDHLDKVVAVLGRSEKGIDFEALDGAPVHFVFLFIVPSKNYPLHLRTLAAIAKMFTNVEIRRRIADAGSREEILAILDPKSSRVAAPGTDTPRVPPP